ncbi:MAG: hypothetical protein ACRCU0_03535 [Candidatus Rhabdochlamydia sp.]
MSALIVANIRPDYVPPSHEMGLEDSNRCDLLVRIDKEAQARFEEYQKTYDKAIALDVAALEISKKECSARGQIMGEAVGTLGVSTLTAVAWWRGWNLPFASLCPLPIRVALATIASIGAIYTAKAIGGSIAVLASTPSSANEKAWKRAVVFKEITEMSLLIVDTLKEPLDEQELQQSRKIAQWAKERLEALKEILKPLSSPEDIFFQV